jgi:hypothetical protein
MKHGAQRLAAAALLLLCLASSPSSAEAQGRGRGAGGGDAAGSPTSVTAQITLTAADREAIRAFYTSRPPQGVEALPPGIRRNLERGKPLPPGIAKRNPPPELRSRLAIPVGYEVVEVGLDVLLVEVATGVIHDVLMDIVR